KGKEVWVIYFYIKNFETETEEIKWYFARVEASPPGDYLGYAELEDEATGREFLKDVMGDSVDKIESY
ncbi:MAG: hypothetical protein AABY22_12240, partial [Nanoarchaeota archaeon]